MSQPSTLMDQLAAHIHHGDHLCVVCEDPQQRLDAAAQYIADGLQRNEFVMYAADPETTAVLRQRLGQRGIDVEDAIRRGALKLPTAHEAYLRDGNFDPDAMYEAFDQAITSALAAGFTGCRFAGEPTWAFEREDLRPGLIEFEKRLNGLFRSRKAAGFCVYDKKAWPASVVRDVLRTHPIAVVGDMVCKRNLYFERPDLIDQEGSAEAQVSWMLTQLRELQAQEARLQVALEAGQLGSWELELHSDTSVRSLRHDQIFGYGHLQPHWGFASFMQHVLPEDRSQVEAAFEQVLENGGTLHFECRIRRHSDGAIRWIEAYGRPDPESRKGGVRRLLGIVSDITERKGLEQALRDTDRRKDEFLATLAHELRNPLAPILNAVQLMRLKNSADPQLKRVQGIIERQVQHLGRLVDDLLEVSRITTGRIVLQRERVDLRSVLQSAVEASQPLMESAGHAFSMSLPQEPVYLEGDSTRLAQVFLNLLNNAAKYTPSGGRIELQASRDRGQVVVRVKDNGVGIEPERIADMFQMFVQGHRIGERAQGGLGIGLPLAKQLLELHGGTIDAHSQGRGEGSEFTVRLPVMQVQQELWGETPEAFPAKGDLRLGRILVVDDNAEAADTLAEALQLLGQEVSVRYDGLTAIEAATQIFPDVVILDIGLPDINGYEVARRFQAMKRKVLLVALTGWGQEKDRQLAREAGFDLHRTKPLDPRELLKAIMALQQQAGQRF